MLASFPASMLNQNTPDLGILNRLKLDPSRSSCHKSTAPQRETEPSMSELNARLHLEAWIEVVTQAVAEQIEGEYCNTDGNAREQNHPRRLTVKVSGVARQHQAPGRGRLLYAEPQKRQRCLRQDRLRDERGQHDEVRRDHVRRHVPKDDSGVRITRSAPA